jgi:dTDP-glucose 4,6-dehydratase/UDP-glucose 4-epimerase
MKVIIIGSKGFIGHNLLNYFQAKGYEVWSADVVVDYVNSERYFQIDASSTDYSAVFQNLTYDVCINCSGAASVPDSLKNPLRDYYLNTVNVYKILNAIKRFQPNCRFINLSSAAVYGNPKHLPVKEETGLDPISPYGIHKLQAEQICKEFHDFYKIQTCSLRIFSVYGIGQQKQLFWDLYNKAKTSVPFTLYGSGKESRDFIYVLDLVKAIEIVYEFSSFKADVINVANGEEIMIKDAVSIFLSLFNYDVIYTFSGESRKGDPVNWVADISKLKSFGYKPSVDIISGLKNYYEWIRTNTCNLYFNPLV